MKKILISSVISFFLFSILFFAGCKSENRNITEPNTDPVKTVNATGQITGRIINSLTNTPIAGVVVSISYNNQNSKAVTDDFGHFTFNGVPVTTFVNESGRAVNSGIYPVTLSLVDLNKKQADSTKRYRDYYYQNINVLFTQGDTLMVTNMVASIDMMLSYCNTTINGFVVDKNNAPAANAVVYLYDESISHALISQTTTDANGAYTFNKVDNGISIYIKAVSADGSMSASLPTNYALDPRITLYNLRPGVSSERLELHTADNIAPFVVSISPEYNSDVQSTSDFKIVYNFSEPVKQNQYTVTGMPKGLSTMIDDIIFTFDGLKKVQGDVGLGLSWNQSFTSLTITPSTVLTTGRYTIDLRTVLSKLKDNSNNYFVDNTNIKGDLSESQKFTISQNLQTTVVPQIFTSSVLDHTGGNVYIQWSSYSDPNVSSFNVYKSTDNQPFQLIANRITTLGYSDAVTTLLYPSLANPLRAISVKYKVTAISKDLIEGTSSNVLEMKDTDQPGTLMDTLSIVSATTDPLGDTTLYKVMLQFDEPMDPALVSDVAQYSMQSVPGYTFTKVSAVYAGYNGSGYAVQLTFNTNLKLTYVTTYKITCSTVKDLAGNLIKATRNVFKCRGYY